MDSSQSDPDQRTEKVKGGERGDAYDPHDLRKLSESQENSKVCSLLGATSGTMSIGLNEAARLENTQPSPRRLSIQGVLSLSPRSGALGHH